MQTSQGGEVGILAKVVRRLSHYGDQSFAGLPRRCRVALLVLLTAPPRHCPYGIVDFRDAETAQLIAENVEDLRVVIREIDSVGLVVTDTESKLLYVKGAFNSHLFSHPSPREVGYWKKFLAKYKRDSCVISCWLADLSKAVNNFPNRSSKAVVSNFFPDMEIKKLDRHPEARSLIDYFGNKFNELGYGTYVPNWVRDLQAAKELLESIELEEVKQRIDKYLSNEWYMNNQGADFKRFQALVNRFASREQQAGQETPGSAYWDIVNKKQKAN